MKIIFRLFSVFVLTLSFMTASYAANPKTDDGTVVTKRQECFLKKYTHLRKNDSHLDIIADLPIAGPKSLVDSITSFLNEQLYWYFNDNEEQPRLPYNKVFSTDAPHLLKHYKKAYKPFFNAKDPDVCEFAIDCLELKMVAQTATFVTYEVAYVHFGEGLEEERSWVTFVKSDGHRLKEVISYDNMVRFMKEHPQQRPVDVWEDIQRNTTTHESPRSYQAGLLNDKMAFQYRWAPGIFDDSEYDLATIKPYLSEEAQELYSGK